MLTGTTSAKLNYDRVLTCATCQARKVKCDRSIPCSRCVKANIPCMPHTPANAGGRRRRPNQDLQSRLARCEELLAQCDGGDTPQSTTSPETRSLPPPSKAGNLKPLAVEVCQPPLKDASPTALPACAQVQTDRGTIVVDGHVWASIHEELKKMQSIVDEDTRDTTCRDWNTSLLSCEVQLLLQGDNPSINTKDLLPEAAHVFYLWQLFLDRVNPLTKIVHAPSLLPYIVDASVNIDSVPLDHQALLFAVYTLAICSLSDDECMEYIGQPRQTMLQRFTLGARIGLARLNFLNRYSMTVLQALVLFLCSLGGRCEPCAAWLLGGIIMRIAQRMGYHRDGEVLNLSPFETEMRRRIWWCIVVQDANYAMVSGLSPSLLLTGWDTKEPQNLNDAEMFTNSSKPLCPREGPTEMMFCLIMYRIYKLTMEMENERPNNAVAFGAELMGHSPDADDVIVDPQPAITATQVAVQNLDRELQDLEEKYLNLQAGSVHIAAASLRPVLLRKLNNMCAPTAQELTQGPESPSPEAKLLKILVISHEYICELYERLAAGRFEWSLRLLAQVDQLGALTGLLQQMPTGELCERGWTAVCKLYTLLPELSDFRQEKFASQAANTVRAWKAREAAIIESGQTATRPTCIVRLQELLYIFPQTSMGTKYDMDIDQLLANCDMADMFWCANGG